MRNLCNYEGVLFFGCGFCGMVAGFRVKVKV